METINLQSVRIALNRDEMEEMVGGSSSGSGGKAVDWACVGIGVLGVASGIVTFGSGTIVAITIGGSFCAGWGAGRLLF